MKLFFKDICCFWKLCNLARENFINLIEFLPLDGHDYKIFQMTILQYWKRYPIKIFIINTTIKLRMEVDLLNREYNFFWVISFSKENMLIFLCAFWRCYSTWYDFWFLIRWKFSLTQFSLAYFTRKRDFSNIFMFPEEFIGKIQGNRFFAFFIWEIYNRLLNLGNTDSHRKPEFFWSRKVRILSRESFRSECKMLMSQKCLPLLENLRLCLRL